ncbi:hypothetical protein ANCCAN_30203 [Ancylostoma caninum]|uniref:Uncharacterized protein n=1 Tax=Ancylostoma caninum TaxID=29170 RepID=A0A368F1M6_ANCCA|nr:hypothetical protein ANCCAN_30203 [Ancylostoma caninum]
MPRKTTTVVVKTVSQQLKEKPTIQSVHGSMENAVDPHTQHMLDQQFQNDPSMEQLRASYAFWMLENLQRVADNAAPETSTRVMESTKSATLPRSPPRTESLDERRGRDREKKPVAPKRERSFFGELRDRLSGRRRSQTQRYSTVRK